MSKITKILNLQKGEEKAVVYLLIYSFFIGAALAFYVTSATSLFLSSFDRDFLPISFIAAGVIVWITGKLMNFLFNKINLSKSIPVGLIILLVSIIVFLILYKIKPFLSVVFLLYAWIRVFAYLHAVTFWTLAGRLFMLRQAKRVFSLITGGEVFASILSFFSIPLLLKFIQTSDLLMISGAFLTFAFLFMLLIVRKFKDKLQKKNIEKKIEKKTDIKLFSSRYFKLIFWIAFVPIFAQFFVDFIFQAQAKIEFPDREELTAFMGLFFGVSAIIEFTLKSFVSGRLLNKYGVKLGLVAFPAVLFISFLLATFFGFIFGTIGIFFSLVTMGRLFTRAVRTSFNDPSSQILFQPIPEEQRVIIRNKIESGPKAYASIVAGVFLLLFSQIPNISLVIFSAILLIVTVLWGKLAVNVYKEYKNKIQSFLSGNVVTDKTNFKTFVGFFSVLTKKNYSFFSKNFIKLFFPYSSKTNDEKEQKLKLSEIVEKANSNSKEDKIDAVKNLPKYTIFKVEKLFSKFLNDEDFDVRNQAIISAGEMNEKELFEQIVNNFKLQDYRKTATNAILKIGDPIIPLIIKTFYSNEYNTDFQLEIVEVLSMMRSNKSIIFLRKLINYPVKIVRERSIEALAKLNYEAEKSVKITISAFLEEEIKQYVYLIASLLDLEDLPDDEFIKVELREELEKKLRSSFDILSLLYDKKAVDLIEFNLLQGDEETKGFAIEIADTVFSEIHKEILLPILEDSSNLDIVKRYKYVFPQEKLGVYDRIIDLINAEVKTTGIFVKVEAIRKLVDFKDKNSVSVLNASIVSPVDIISETAAFTLFLIDEAEFDRNLSIFKLKKKSLNILFNKIKQLTSDDKLLILEKIQLLKSLSEFNKLTNNELYFLATHCKRVILSEEFKFQIDTFTQTDVLIVVSGQLKMSGKIYESGTVISKYFVKYSDTEFLVTETAMIFKVPLFVVNHLIISNINFAKSVFGNIILIEETEKKAV